ncbi:MAG TPA: TIGR03435 family protein [Bryobacteraceae bacterium]|nr:TIGR03435 family protein [Bryobacteraceae bacterium]
MLDKRMRHLPLRFLTSLFVLITTAIGQTQSPPGPQFEVASIKSNTSRTRQVSIGASSPRAFKAENVWLRFLIQMAWNVKDYQLSGGPDWATSNRYDIDARTNTDATFEQMRPMLQILLEDRFQLALHRESKDLPVYTLVAAKGGIKLKVPAKENCVANDKTASPSAPAPGQTFLSFCGGMVTGPHSLNGTAISTEQLTTALSNTMQRTVIDQTGLTGSFDVHLEWTADQSTPGFYAPGFAPPPSALPAEGSGPTIFTALQEQLGLKLESTKRPVTTLIIDHAVRPSAN